MGTTEFSLLILPILSTFPWRHGMSGAQAGSNSSTGESDDGELLYSFRLKSSSTPCFCPVTTPLASRPVWSDRASLNTTCSFELDVLAAAWWERGGEGGK